MRTLLLITVLALTAFAPPPRKATVYIFISSKCPCIYSHQEEVQWLEKKYGSVVEFRAVFIDKTDDPEDIATTMKNLGWKMGSVRDNKHMLTRQYHPKVYTDCVLVSADGAVLYRGAIDDSALHMGQVQHSYLQNALGEFLAGGEVMIKQATGAGCMIVNE
jgi:hypothetical protein